MIFQASSSASSISTIVGNVGDLVTAAVSWITSYVGAITSNPLILMFVIFGLIGTGVGLIRRLMRV